MPFVFAVVTMGCLAGVLIAGARGAAVLSGILKMIASTSFIALAVSAGALETWYGWAILVALFFSWWGDLFLIWTQSTLFLMGLIVFFLGHLGFAAAFAWGHGVSLAWTLVALVILLVPMVILVHWLNPGLGGMRIPVYAYMAVITVMVALSAGAVGNGGTPLMIIGAVLFYVSDVFVARERFITSDGWNRLIGLPIYYGGQLILAYTVAFVTQ